MRWRPARFRGDRVFVEVDTDGQLAASGGRVAIRYDAREGARLYRAGVSRVELDADGSVVDLPDGVDADAPAAATAPAKKTTKRPSSGFGKAGTRTASQAAAARTDAHDRLARLEPGTVVAYADGACRGNPGPAGSGAVVVLPDGRRAEAAAALGRATNNIAELTAVGLVLDMLDEAGVPPDAPVVLLTDSSYSDGVLTRGWKAKANGELVAELKARIARRSGLRLEWIAGHVGVEGNERADALANLGVSGIDRRTPFPDPPG